MHFLSSISLSFRTASRHLQGTFLVALLLGSRLLSAQSTPTPGPNIVSHGALEWKHVSTDNFDIHFYGSGPFLATDVAHYAEEALFDLSQKLDYRYRSRFALYLYLTPQDLISSHRFPEASVREGGFTPLRINSRNLLFPGSHAGLQDQTREAVGALLMEDFYFGGNLQHSIQNTVLLYLPRWYEEGLPAYLGEGWSFDDEVWLASLRPQGKALGEGGEPLEYALEGEGKLNHVLRKSVWYYVADQYGESKLSELFYMTRLTRSVESGVLHVTGQTMKTFTENWRQFILKRIEENRMDRDDPSQLGKRVSLPKNERLLSFAAHPTLGKVAAWLEKDGVSHLAVVDLSSGIWKEAGIRVGFPTDQLARYQHENPIAWSPDGNRLATSFIEKGKHVLAFVEVSSSKVTRTQQLSKSVDRIFALAWNHAGTQLVCSALLQGQIDLFTFKPTDQKYTRLTEDAYDDLMPVWDADDANLLYASNHGSDSVIGEKVGFEVYSNDFDIYQIPADGSQAARRVARTPGINEMPVGMVSSYELLTLSDEMGIYNLQRLNIFLGKGEHVTNMSPGFWRVNRTDTLLVWSQPNHGALELRFAGASLASEPREVLVAPLRSQIEFFELQKRLLLEAKLKPVRPSNQEAVPVTPADSVETAPSDTAKQAVKYYVFDEDESRPRTKKRVTVRLGPAAVTPDAEVPSFANIKLKGPSSTGAVWSADQINTQLQWDPVFRLGMLFQARFTDQRGFHQLAVGYRPYFDFKSSDVYANFKWLRHRADFHAGAYRNARTYTRSEFLLRYQAIGLQGGVSYPLNRFASVGVDAHLNHIRRLDLNPFLGGILDGTDWVAGASAHFTYSKLKSVENFIQRGTWLRIESREVYSLANMRQNFLWNGLDARKYTPIMGKMVLATRLSAGFSIGPQRSKLFLGGANDWLFGRLDNPKDLPFNENVSEFQYSGFITPVRGFSWNARNGTQFVTVNAELRLPLSRMLTQGLNSDPVYSLEVIPFFDVGTVWTQGNPLSQQNPIDTETITGYPVSITVQTLKSPFIMGMGAGARMMVVGYSMRMDMAWGVEDQTLLKPRLYLSLGKDF